MWEVWFTLHFACLVYTRGVSFYSIVWLVRKGFVSDLLLIYLGEGEWNSERERKRRVTKRETEVVTVTQ